MLKLSKPEQTITENGITYLLRTPEQVEQDLTRLVQKYDREDDFKTYWRKLLSAKIPVCPVCGEAGGPIRKTVYDADELIGVKEAAEILGWDTRRVTTYRSRGSFPEPVTELAMGPVWTREQIENYKREKTAK